MKIILTYLLCCSFLIFANEIKDDKTKLQKETINSVFYTVTENKYNNTLEGVVIFEKEIEIEYIFIGFRIYNKKGEQTESPQSVIKDFKGKKWRFNITINKEYDKCEFSNLKIITKEINADIIPVKTKLVKSKEYDQKYRN